MGEEYGETAPFCFFTSFSAPELVEAVRAGRRREFAKFAWETDIPDPQDPATFAASRLDHARRTRPPHAHVWAWYQALLRLRRSHPALRHPDRARTRVSRAGQALVLERWAAAGAEAVLVILSYDPRPSRLEATIPDGAWRLELDSEAPAFGGTEAAAGPPALTGGPAGIELRPYQARIYLR
jgi:maltooligosyltrehalose trehalohydrolase